MTGDVRHRAAAWLDDDVDVQMLHLFGLVSEGIVAATSLFLAGDRVGIERVATNEERVNDVFADLERAARSELLAGDAIASERARVLVVAMQVAPELERTGDLVEHIAQRGGHGLASSLSPQSCGMIERMGALAAEMWRVAASAYLEGQPDAAAALRRRDDDLDDLHVTLISQLADEPLSVAVAIEVGLVARFYERLGDHAVNVARRLEELRAA